MNEFKYKWFLKGAMCKLKGEYANAYESLGVF